LVGILPALISLLLDEKTEPALAEAPGLASLYIHGQEWHFRENFLNVFKFVIEKASVVLHPVLRVFGHVFIVADLLVKGAGRLG